LVVCVLLLFGPFFSVTILWEFALGLNKWCCFNKCILYHIFTLTWKVKCLRSLNIWFSWGFSSSRNQVFVSASQAQFPVFQSFQFTIQISFQDFMAAIQWVTISVSNNLFICQRILARFSVRVFLCAFLCRHFQVSVNAWASVLFYIKLYCTETAPQHWAACDCNNDTWIHSCRILLLALRLGPVATRSTECQIFMQPANINSNEK
jgi:hypothetical protein